MPKKPPTPERALTESLARIKASRPNAYEGYKVLDGLQKSGDKSGHSDRATVIICAALLELALEEAITSHFLVEEEDIKARLFLGRGEREAPIQSLYAKSYLGYALGIFGPKTLQRLNAIRDIRNLCAHNIALFSFDMPEFEPLRDLIGARRNMLMLTIGPDPDLREAFIASVQMLYVYLFDLLPSEHNEGRLPKYYQKSMYPILFS